MTILVGQAVYGERNKGHALLARSPQAAIASGIVNLMDIQGTVPPATEWRPYWSGSAHEGHYVLSYTMADPTATRPGMVRSRALIAPLSDFVRHDDILPLLKLLADPVDTDQPLSDIEFSGSRLPTIGHGGLANALLADGTGPVVWASDQDFGSAVSALWHQLWPDARAGLSFGIAFNPQDIVSRTPSIVVTPPSLAQRWSGFRTVRGDEEPNGPAAALLAGRPEGAGLANLMVSLDAQLSRISDLLRLSDVAQALRGLANFADGVDALRLVSLLSPSPSAGASEKGRILSSTVNCMVDALLAEIRMCRNLSLSAMDNGRSFWTNLADWAATRMWTVADHADIASLLVEARSTVPVREWREAIWNGTTERLSGCDLALANKLWGVIASRPELVQPTLQRRHALEEKLADAAPQSLDMEKASALLEAARVGEFRQLHAAICAASLPPEQSIRRHVGAIAVDAASVARALRKATKKARVALAATIDNDELRALGAATAAEEPALLASLDIKEAGWRQLWEAAILLNPSCWSGPRHAATAFHWLLEQAANGGDQFLSLLMILASTPLADLSSYSDRQNLWHRLDPSVRELLLAATARGWAKRFLANEVDTPAETHLSERLVQYPIQDELLRGIGNNLELGCRLFRCVPALSEAQFVAWARTAIYACPISAESADSLGRLVATRSWSDAARLFADVALEGRDDLRPAISYFVELLGMITQYRLDMFLERSPAAAKWRTLEELGVELYGIGPGEHGLWERAGGKKADIPNARSGREAWRQVVSDMERGARRISLRKLIETMYDDYRDNPTLRKMRWDNFFS